MKNKFSSTEKYLESARKFKSPISMDMARSIIEMSDLKNSAEKTFLSKYGVKIMTISSVLVSSLIIFAISSGIFQDAAQNSFNGKSSVSKTQEISTKVSEPEQKITEPLTNTETKSKALASNQSKPFPKPENSTSIIKGINTIKLTDAEVAKFGIFNDSITGTDKVSYGVGFWYMQGESAAIYSVYSVGNGSTHKMEKFPSEKEINFIKVYPNVITDYQGRIYAQLADAMNDDTRLNEFISYYRSFSDFYNLEFVEKYFPEKIPNEINQQLSELQQLFEKYSDFEGIDQPTRNLIDLKFKSLHKYFSKISESGKIKDTNSKPQLSSADTSSKTNMTIYLDHDADSSDYKSIENMTKMGMNINFEKHPLTMSEFLNKNYSKLGEKLSSLRNLTNNYMMMNQMLAIEIPLKNEPEKGGVIFWYAPSQELIDALPSRYRSDLSKEFKLFENEDAICGAVVPTEKSYLDVWRACNGAIENLRTFPNPVKNIFTVRFELKEKRTMNFAIHDVNGSKIKDLSQNNHLNSGSNSLTFDISQIKTGMYLIVGTSANGENVVQRIIKE